MKLRLVKLTLISSGALLVAQAFAQPPAQPGGAGATGTRQVANASSTPNAPKLPAAHVDVAATAVAATARPNVGAPSPMPARTLVTAAGSVIILVDGKVAHAALAQIQPPAPGFVYER